MPELLGTSPSGYFPPWTAVQKLSSTLWKWQAPSSRSPEAAPCYRESAAGLRTLESLLESPEKLVSIYHWPSLPLLYRMPTNLAAKLFKWPACSSIGHNPNRCVNSRGAQGSGCSGRVSVSLPSSEGYPCSLMCTPWSLFELVSPCFCPLCCENHCDWLHWSHRDIQTILLWIANTLIPSFSLPPKPRHSQLLRTWMFTS